MDIAHLYGQQDVWGHASLNSMQKVDIFSSVRTTSAIEWLIHSELVGSAISVPAPLGAVMIPKKRVAFL
jgi:hypothetical protein